MEKKRFGNDERLLDFSLNLKLCRSRSLAPSFPRDTFTKSRAELPAADHGDALRSRAVPRPALFNLL